MPFLYCYFVLVFNNNIVTNRKETQNCCDLVYAGKRDIDTISKSVLRCNTEKCIFRTNIIQTMDHTVYTKSQKLHYSFTANTNEGKFIQRHVKATLKIQLYMQNLL